MGAHANLRDVLAAYSIGLFPMADARDADEFFWYDPPLRGQLPIENLHVPARLRDTVLAGKYDITVDTDFSDVIDGCAAATDKRPQTWINQGIRDLFIELRGAGFAHSVECRDKSGVLVGGIYGLALGGAFMGESMFSRARDASKVALVHLCARLHRGGFTLFDTQFVNPHLLQFGAYEIPAVDYKKHLAGAVRKKTDFRQEGVSESAIVRGYLEAKRHIL